ncbi:MAG: transglutaminase-like domain-containing protein [Spirochaetia bacterium]|jgi:transglutaminase-like putative cysteine protease|nr:transglutaminase-like domain-containing protein [Spirochaetia bacterium]
MRMRSVFFAAMVFLLAAGSPMADSLKGENIFFSEDFENGLGGGHPWILGGKVPPYVTSAAEQKITSRRNMTKFLKLSAATAGECVLDAGALYFPQDTLCSFSYRVSLNRRTSRPAEKCAFTLNVDGKEEDLTGTRNSGASEWHTKEFFMPAGGHTLVFSVTNPAGKIDDSLPNGVFLDDIRITAIHTVAPGFTETFDSPEGKIAPPWYGQAKLDTAEKRFGASPPAVRERFGNPTRFAVLSLQTIFGTTTEILGLKYLKTDKQAALSFRFVSGIMERYGQTFKLYLDDKVAGSWAGLGGPWRTESIIIPPGIHSIRFEARSTGTSTVGAYNAVFIDDIRFVHDETDSLEVFPRGVQETFMGAPEAYKLRFSGRALRGDGSPRKDFTGFSFSVSGGDGNAAIDEGGVFTPSAPGTYLVTVSAEGKTAQSSDIIVHDGDYYRKPYTYPGTGKTYAGYSGKGSGEIPPGKNLEIRYPQAREFEADGFFTLEGTVKSSASGSVSVSKKDEGGPYFSSASYTIAGDFRLRVWLPFGKGEYSVSVYVPGDYHTLSVRNTREEETVDGDGRWIYPSGTVQSDDLRFTNLINHLCPDLVSPGEKIRAVHDFLVPYMQYDLVSYRNPSRRKKQDALSALANRMGVCDGYAHVTAAMMRAAGVPTKIINATRRIQHAWNHVYLDGAWKFLDTTWDDPIPDGGEYSIDYHYYLLDNLSDDRHGGTGREVVGDD